MKKLAFVLTVLSLFFINSAYAANCITQKRGMNILWHGNGGSLTLTKVHKMTKSFAVTIALNNKGNVIYSGAPSRGFKQAIPKGTQNVFLNITSGQGEVCYVR